jgi:hypothetical protein
MDVQLPYGDLPGLSIVYLIPTKGGNSEEECERYTKIHLV